MKTYEPWIARTHDSEPAPRPSIKAPAMATYSKWTARITIVSLWLIAFAGLMLAPVGTGAHGVGRLRHSTGVVWPLPETWGKHHLFADGAVGLVWCGVALAIVGFAFWIIVHLYRRAEWGADY